MASDTVLSIQNISKSFGGVQANRDVSFEVEQGQIFSIIGPGT